MLKVDTVQRQSETQVIAGSWLHWYGQPDSTTEWQYTNTTTNVKRNRRLFFKNMKNKKKQS